MRLRRPPSRVVAVGSDAGRKPRNTAEFPEVAAVLAGVCVRPETEEPAHRAPGSCGDSPSSTSVRAAVHPTPSSPNRRPRARSEGRWRPVGWGSGPATTWRQDHARIAAPQADSSWRGPYRRQSPQGSPPTACGCAATACRRSHLGAALDILRPGIGACDPVVVPTSAYFEPASGRKPRAELRSEQDLSPSTWKPSPSGGGAFTLTRARNDPLAGPVAAD
jgi:hypothetical protein